MPYIDKYPKNDAHGVAIERVKVIKLTTGESQVFLDDGYDSIDGEYKLHQQLDMLATALRKRVRDPVTGAKVPAYVLDGHTFKPRLKKSGDSATLGQHPLSGSEEQSYANNKTRYDEIINHFKGARAKIVEDSIAAAAPLIDQATRAAKAAKAKGA